jgi:hypothetical protein
VVSAFRGKQEGPISALVVPGLDPAFWYAYSASVSLHPNPHHVAASFVYEVYVVYVVYEGS